MKKNIFEIKKNRQGMSLLELVVAMGIFVIVTLIVNGIYINIVRSQQQAIASQTTQESFRFAFEMMSKELRSAQGLFDGSDCASGMPGYYKIFNNAANDSMNLSSALYFKNVDGKCVVYDLDNNRLRIKRGSDIGYITPNELTILDLKFLINDGVGGVVGAFQPSVTVMVEAEVQNLPSERIKMQTTISSREYTY